MSCSSVIKNKNTSFLQAALILPSGRYFRANSCGLGELPLAVLGLTTPKGFSSELSLKRDLYNIIKMSKLSMRGFVLVTQTVFIKAIDVMENNRIHEKAGECSRQKKKRLK